MFQLILFDGSARDHLLPLTFTRPVAELRTGILTIREKWEKHLGVSASWLTAGYLQDKYPLVAGDDNLLVNGSLLPDRDLVSALMQLPTGHYLTGGKKHEILLGYKTGREETKLFAQTGHPDGVEVRYTGEFYLIAYPWDIFIHNGKEIQKDFHLLTASRTSGALNEGNRVMGNFPVFLEEGARADYSIFNTTDGPVYLGKNARVMEGSMIRGPFALGAHAEVKMGARIYGNTSTGPWCKIGGEITDSVFQSYSNKAHEGFLGHSVLGEWCNLGADTNTSNLKNNYAQVKMWNYPSGRFISTGLQLCGLVMGDHAKCGINTMFNTGTVVGISANIFGDGFPRNFIPSFSWGGSHGFEVYQPQKAMETARLMMERRNILLEETDRKIMEEVFRLTESYRNF